VFQKRHLAPTCCNSVLVHHLRKVASRLHVRHDSMRHGLLCHIGRGRPTHVQRTTTTTKIHNTANVTLTVTATATVERQGDNVTTLCRPVAQRSRFDRCTPPLCVQHVRGKCGKDRAFARLEPKRPVTHQSIASGVEATRATDCRFSNCFAPQIGDCATAPLHIMQILQPAFALQLVQSPFAV
jgi:hypothetical protein